MEKKKFRWIIGGILTTIRRYAPLLVALGAFLPALQAQGATATFDFDTGSPALVTGQLVPFNQTANGVTAQFSSPQGSVFSVQSDSTTFLTLSEFSMKYLYPNNTNHNLLDIQFNQQLSAISFVFATADAHQQELTTPLKLSAYLNSTQNLVGSTTASGVYGSDSMPMGTLSFASVNPFNLVEIETVIGMQNINSFLVDNIDITYSGTTVPEPSTMLLLGSGLIGLAGYGRKRFFKK